MTNTSATALRKNLFSMLSNAIKYNETINVNTKDGNAVILSEEEYKGLIATLELSSNRALREKILAGKDAPIEECVSMKKFILVLSLCLMILLLAGCAEKEQIHRHNFNEEVSVVYPTCIKEGLKVVKCEGCEETKEIKLETSGHVFGEYTITKMPAIDEYGMKEAICENCGYVDKQTMMKLGYSWYTPIDIDTEVFYKEICNGKFDQYDGLWVRLKGTVKEISNYSDMKGYYIYGTKGRGIVGWVYSWQSNQLLAKVGDEVIINGKVQNEGDDHVELVECRFE